MEKRRKFKQVPKKFDSLPYRVILEVLKFHKVILSNLPNMREDYLNSIFTFDLSQRLKGTECLNCWRDPANRPKFREIVEKVKRKFKHEPERFGDEIKKILKENGDTPLFLDSSKILERDKYHLELGSDNEVYIRFCYPIKPEKVELFSFIKEFTGKCEESTLKFITENIEAEGEEEIGEFDFNFNLSSLKCEGSILDFYGRFKKDFTRKNFQIFHNFLLLNSEFVKVLPLKLIFLRCKPTHGTRNVWMSNEQKLLRYFSSIRRIEYFLTELEINNDVFNGLEKSFLKCLSFRINAMDENTYKYINLCKELEYLQLVTSSHDSKCMLDLPKLIVLYASCRGETLILNYCRLVNLELLGLNNFTLVNGHINGILSFLKDLVYISFCECNFSEVENEIVMKFFTSFMKLEKLEFICCFDLVLGEVDDYSNFQISPNFRVICFERVRNLPLGLFKRILEHSRVRAVDFCDCDLSDEFLDMIMEIDVKGEKVLDISGNDLSESLIEKVNKEKKNVKLVDRTGQ